ncbi:hypothetical protein ID866_7889 [Astraeus odoratus]|nr:hypothetical protein ID866_7889 [Astraeus odoratus]
MLKGAAKLAPWSAKQDLREPITREMIEVIGTQLQREDPLDITFFACLTTKFYLAAHVGEFTLKKLDTFNPQLHITAVQVHDDTDCNRYHTKVFVCPSTKASPKGEEVNWAKKNGPSDPSEAFRWHVQMNNLPTTGPLFAYKHRLAHCPLTWQVIISKLKKVAKAASFQSVHGHGIRIGATLEYLLWGVPFEVMKVKGWWASDTFQLYLQQHNQILAPYIQAMPPETALDFTRIAMPPVP